ncbi:MAG: SLC13 family permease [Phycisphaerales bacterium]|nr:MAG: SLC13 family permease [Phycisphaerales bacterium]
MSEAWIVFIVLAAALVMFIGGWWRYDVVALLALLILALLGIVPAGDAFSGFGHAAVITVASVLVVSRALSNAGVIHPIARVLRMVGNRPLLQIAGLTALVAVASAFINNVGALAILMPVAISMARKSGISPSLLLMPLAFGSLLGGLLTLIGTPPNIIIATYRAEVNETPFRMFDFAPVGLVVAVAGVLFITLIGWRLIPQRQPHASADELFDISDYLAELRVPEDSKLIGKSLVDFSRELAEASGSQNDSDSDADEKSKPASPGKVEGAVEDAAQAKRTPKEVRKAAKKQEKQRKKDIKKGRAAPDGEIETIIVGLFRHGRKIAAPSRYETIQAGDVLTVEVDPELLRDLVDRTGLELTGGSEEDDHPERAVSTDEIKVVEAVVSPDSSMVGRTAGQLHLRWRHGMNLLAVARQGSRTRSPLRQVRFQPGDILLLQGPEGSVHESLGVLGCLPLADRELQIGQPSRVLSAVGIFGIAIVLTAVGLVPVQIAFAGAALLMVMSNLVSLRGAYEAIDWSIIVLLAAMIPVGTALETSGGAEMIASSLITMAATMPAAIMIALLLLVTMLLSNVINNAAAAVLMAPIAIGLGSGMDASADPFLMAVAIGASCAFLTPIGHQSNTLVMGPGGYHFGDYWRLGLPVSVIVLLTAVPMILVIWPL